MLMPSSDDDRRSSSDATRPRSNDALLMKPTVARMDASTAWNALFDAVLGDPADLARRVGEDKLGSMTRVRRSTRADSSTSRSVRSPVGARVPASHARAVLAAAP